MQGLLGAGLSVGGSLLGGAMGGSGDVNSNFQSIADAEIKAAQQAQLADQTYLQKALNLQTDMYNLGYQQTLTGENQAKGYLAPYQFQGDQALDAYSNSLGLNGIVGGSFNLQQAEQAQAAQQNEAALMPQLQSIANEFNSGGLGIGNLSGMFSGPNAVGNAISYLQNQAQQFALTPQGGMGTGGQQGNLLASIASQYAQDQAIAGTETPEQAYDLAQFQAGSSTPANPVAGLQQFFNTPGYLLNYGSNPVENQAQGYNPVNAFWQSPSAQVLLNNGGNSVNPNATFMQRFADSQFGDTILGNYDPNKSLAQNYTQSPGYQYQMSQGMNNLTNSSAASGLLNSTPFAQNVLQYSQGLANQDFTQYQTQLSNAISGYNADVAGVFGSNQNNLNSLYNSWQSNLGQLAGQGQQTANQLGQISTDAANSLVGQGQNYANQGSSLNQSMGTNAANSILAQGAAQAGALTNQTNYGMQNATSGASMGGYLGSNVAPSLFGSGGGSSGGGSGGGGGSSLSSMASLAGGIGALAAL